MCIDENVRITMRNYHVKTCENGVTFSGEPGRPSYGPNWVNVQMSFFRDVYTVLYSDTIMQWYAMVCVYQYCYMSFSVAWQCKQDESTYAVFTSAYVGIVKELWKVP